MYNQNKHAKKDAIPLRYPKDSFTWMLGVERGLEREDGTLLGYHIHLSKNGAGRVPCPLDNVCNILHPHLFCLLVLHMRFQWQKDSAEGKAETFEKPPT